MTIGVYNVLGGVLMRTSTTEQTFSVCDAKLLREQLDAAITHAERISRVSAHMDSIKAAMRDGRKINAIKLLRELPQINDPSRPPIGLLEAKQIVEHLL